MTAHPDAQPSAAVERFNALLRESTLNSNPDLDPRQYRISLLSDELWRSKDNARRSALAAEIFLIQTHQTIDAEATRGDEKPARSPRPHSPMLDLARDLLDASLSRAKLGIAPPSALRGLSRPSAHEPISPMAEDALRVSLAQTQEAITAHRNGDEA